MYSSSREVGARPCLASQARASSRSFSCTCTVRVEYASICACVTPRISFLRPSARGIHATPNSAVSSHSTAVAATACRALRTPRTLAVSRARHLPSLKVRVTPAQACRYSSAARLARCKISWNACSRPAQYPAACWSPARRARRSFFWIEACRTEMDLENEAVMSV